MFLAIEYYNYISAAAQFQAYKTSWLIAECVTFKDVKYLV